MSKAKELRELALDELEQKLADSVKEAFELQKVKATGKLDNPLQMRLARREIARLHTLIHEKKVTAQGEKAGGTRLSRPT